MNWFSLCQNVQCNVVIKAPISRYSLHKGPKSESNRSSIFCASFGSAQQLQQTYWQPIVWNYIFGLRGSQNEYFRCKVNIDCFLRSLYVSPIHRLSIIMWENKKDLTLYGLHQQCFVPVLTTWTLRTNVKNCVFLRNVCTIKHVCYVCTTAGATDVGSACCCKVVCIDQQAWQLPLKHGTNVRPYVRQRQ